MYSPCWTQTWSSWTQPPVDNLSRLCSPAPFIILSSQCWLMLKKQLIHQRLLVQPNLAVTKRHKHRKREATRYKHVQHRAASKLQRKRTGVSSLRWQEVVVWLLDSSSTLRSAAASVSVFDCACFCAAVFVPLFVRYHLIMNQITLLFYGGSHSSLSK